MDGPGCGTWTLECLFFEYVLAMRFLGAPRLRVLVVGVAGVEWRARLADAARLALAVGAMLWNGTPILAALVRNVAGFGAHARLAEAASAAFAEFAVRGVLAPLVAARNRRVCLVVAFAERELAAS